MDHKSTLEVLKQQCDNARRSGNPVFGAYEAGNMKEPIESLT
ncbi:MAG: hypothetical protein AAF530_19150 [Pseudomonadota bacterium]